MGDWKAISAGLSRGLLNLLTNDVIAKIDALVTNEDGRPCNQLSDLVLTLATKRAVKELIAVCAVFRHYVLPG